MFLRIKESALVQFFLKAEPLKPFYQNNNSPEMDEENNNQDNCDDYVGLDHSCITYCCV